MLLIDQKITLAEFKNRCCTVYQDMSKAVVDIQRRCMAVDAEMHADEETLLLENGSHQEDLWGINMYPDKSADDLIEFSSLINIRPSQNNTEMEITSEKLRKEIKSIVLELIDAAV